MFKTHFQTFLAYVREGRVSHHPLPFALIAEKLASDLGITIFSTLILIGTTLGIVWDFSEGWQGVCGSLIDLSQIVLALLILRSQQRGERALQAKTDELLEKCTDKSCTRGIEDQLEEQIEQERIKHAKQLKKLNRKRKG